MQSSAFFHESCEGKNGINSARSWLKYILRFRDSTLSVEPEVEHVLEELHSMTHKLKAPITTTILDTISSFLNRDL